jgi:hypothetical protein
MTLVPGVTKVAIVTLAAVVALACAGGCSDGSEPRTPRGCTLIGCVNGLSVQFSRPLREAGSYTVTMDLDGERITCETALPFASCSGGSPCSSSKVILEQSGCALPPSAHEILGLRVTSVARTVSLRIDRDGGEIASESFTPSYARSAPNGEGCGPICEQASATLSIP